MNKTAKELQEACTPEELFQIPGNAPHTQYADAMSCILWRAKAMLHFLEADGEDINIGFTADHRTIMNALWAISGHLEQAIQLNKHTGEGGAK